MPEIVIRYKPQKHQLKWHNNPTRFLVAVCGRQIGKTTAAINELIMRALNNPDSRNWYVTNDYRQAKRNVWQELKKYIPKAANPKYNEAELSVIFPNYSRIELIGVENAERLRGAAVHFMVLDEYADFSRRVWPEVLSKMFTTTNGDAWFLGTPKGMGNDFHDKYFKEDKEVTKYRMPSCIIKGKKVVSVLSQYASIPVIQHAFENDPPDSFRQEYLADFVKPAGTVYNEWNMENFKPVPYDVNLPIHITMDFGVNDPTAIVWIQPNGSEYRVIDYYEAANANIDHFIQVIRSKPYKEPEFMTGDPAGKARAITTGTSPIQEMAAKGLHLKTTDGVRIQDQIRLCHKMIPSLYVDNNLKRFRDCLLNYRYPSDIEHTSKLDTSKEIPVHDEFSHAMRALEYYAVNIKDYITFEPVIVGYEEGLGGAQLPIYRFNNGNMEENNEE